MVGSTADVDARDNTSTTYTGDDKGVAIYWLNGAKVADEYEDFYDGDWDEETNAKDESGADRSISGVHLQPFTGSNHNGTEALSGQTSNALGADFVRVGRPNSSESNHGPLSSPSSQGKSSSFPLYGLSPVFRVEGQANTAPAFTTGADFSTDENEGISFTVTAMDADAGDAVTYAITGGADQARFGIHATNGLLASPTLRDYENPVDADGNNVYLVTVTATGGTGDRALTTDQAITVTVKDVDEPPAAPAAPTVVAVAGSSDSLSVRWAAPDNAGKPDIDSYDLQYRKGTTGDWTDGPQDQTDKMATITGLDADSAYELHVRASNDEGDGVWSSPGTGATHADVLVGNLTEAFSILTVKTIELDWAQAFDTGSNTEGYSLESIALRIAGGTLAAGTLTVTVRADSAGSPGTTALYTLTNPEELGGGTTPAVPALEKGLLAFTAPAGATLDPNTTYWVVFVWDADRADGLNKGGPRSIKTRLRHGIDAGGAPGWTIDAPAQKRHLKDNIPWNVADAAGAMKIQVRGAPNGDPDSNAPPAFAAEYATRDVPENSAAATDVGDPVMATDSDPGATLTYTLEGYDAASFGIVAASGQIQTKSGVTYDFEERQSYLVTVKADDGNEQGADTIAVTINLTDVDEPAAAADVAFTSDPGADATYAIGDAIQATVTFAEAVTVTGTPQITLQVGDGTRTADYASGSGSVDLVFSYTVAVGDADSDGVAVEAGSVALNGGTIMVGATAATLTHQAEDANPAHTVDGVRPTLESAETNVDGAPITLVFDEPYDVAAATVVTAAPFSVTAGGSTVTVGALGVVMEPGSVYRRFELRNLSPAITYGQTVIVSYTDPTTGDDTTMVLQDAAGNDVTSFTTGSDGVPAVVNNVSQPAVAVVAFTSGPGDDDTYAIGDALQATVTFGEAVTVTGTPQIEMQVGGAPRTADYASGGGSTDLVFSYTVVEGDEDTDGVAVEAGTIALNGGTIQMGTTDAARTHEAEAANPAHKVDGIRPIFESAETSVDGTTFFITFSEPISAANPTSFALSTGTSLTLIEIDGAVVELDPSSDFAHGTTRTISLSSGAVRDLADNANSSSNNHPITNKVPEPNAPPAFESAAVFSVNENETLVGTVEATDDNAGDAVRYAITGGADSGQFQIDETNGVLRFMTAPDYEMPADVASTDPADDAGNNVYLVTVTATSGTGDRELTVMQTITVTVDDAAETQTDSQLAPSNLAATLENGDVRLNWNAPDVDAASVTGYAIFRANPQLTPPAPLVIYVSNTSNTNTTFLDTEPVAGTRNTYRVAARRGSVGSETSNFAFVEVPPLSVSSVALTSAPGSDNTYAIGDSVEATVTFSAEVDIAGAPQLELDFAGTAKAAACATATNTTTMVCEYEVVAGDSATNGVAIAADKLTGGTITATGSTTITADLDHLAVAIDAGHKVDGIRPTLESAETSMDGTSIDLVFDEELDFYGSAGFDSSVYSVTADGSAVTFGGNDTVADEGITPFVYRTLRLTFLSPAITYGQTVIVSYTDPTDRDNVFQDEAGNDVASFTTGSGGVPAVVNNVPADATPSPTVDIDAKDSVEVFEGRQVGLEVRLRSAPSTDVTVTVMSNYAGKVTVMPASLAFTTANWDDYQEVDVTSVEDSDSSDEIVMLTLSGAGLTTKTVTVDVADDEMSLTLPSRVPLTEGGTATIDVTLASAPSARFPRTVAVSSGDEAAVRVAPSSLTFTSTDWNQAHTVTLTAEQDGNTTGEQVTISFSSRDVQNRTVTVNVTDDDSGGGGGGGGGGAPLNRSPEFTDGSTTDRSIAENTLAGADIGEPVAATDPDTDTLTYTLGGADAESFAIVAATGQIQVGDGTILDYEAEKNTYVVQVTATDSSGATAMIAVTIAVTNLDEAGTVTLSPATPVIDTELTATLGDPDGGVTGVTWQWARDNTTGGTFDDIISGATSESYTPVDADTDMYLRVTASYTDGHGTGKSTSAVSDYAVTDYAVTDGDPLFARYDANGNGMIDKAEVIQAINDYLFGEGDEAISKAEVIELINLYLFGGGGGAVTDGDLLFARYDANGNGMIDKAEVIQAINDYLFGEGDEAISKAEVIELINLYLFG